MPQRLQGMEAKIATKESNDSDAGQYQLPDHPTVFIDTKKRTPTEKTAEKRGKCITKKEGNPITGAPPAVARASPP